MLGKMYSNNNAYRVFLRRMVRGGFRFQDKKNSNYRYVISNLRLHEIRGISDLSSFIKSQQRNYAMHVIRYHGKEVLKVLKYVLRGRPNVSK